jgi:hypothetical protein
VYIPSQKNGFQSNICTASAQDNATISAPNQSEIAGILWFAANYPEFPTHIHLRQWCNTWLKTDIPTLDT